MIIWRFYRLTALIDGIETHENLSRCIINSYSFTRFWRCWLIPLCFSVAYTFGLAKSINFSQARIETFIALFAIIAALVAILVPSEVVDETAQELLSFYDIGNSSLPRSYLTGKGGLFQEPIFPILFTSLGSYLLMWTQIH